MAAIAAVLGGVRLWVWSPLPDWAQALIGYELYVNCAILALNLMPAFPLDGGRVLRSLLWRRWGDRDRATLAAARGGRGFGFVLAATGVLSFLGGAPGGLWLSLIGWFLIVASGAEAQASRAAELLGGERVADLMSSPAACLGERMTVADAIADGFAHHLYSSFPVVDADHRPVGLLTLADVRAVAASDRATTLVGDAAQHDRELVVAPDLPAVDLMAQPAFRRVGRAAVAEPGGPVSGLVSVSDLERRLRDEELARRRAAGLGLATPPVGTTQETPDAR